MCQHIGGTESALLNELSEIARLNIADTSHFNETTSSLVNRTSSCLVTSTGSRSVVSIVARFVNVTDSLPLNSIMALPLNYAHSPFSSDSDDSYLFSGDEHFAYDNELVDEGILFGNDALNLGLGDELSGLIIPHRSGDSFIMSTGNAPQAAAQPPLVARNDVHDFTSTSRQQNSTVARSLSTRASCKSTAETRLELINRRLKHMTTAEKIMLLGRIISEGWIPQKYHGEFRRKLKILRKRFQIEKETGP
jgi:hypothetical protein